MRNLWIDAQMHCSIRAMCALLSSVLGKSRHAYALCRSTKQPWSLLIGSSVYKVGDVRVDGVCIAREGHVVESEVAMREACTRFSSGAAVYSDIVLSKRGRVFCLQSLLSGIEGPEQVKVTFTDISATWTMAAPHALVAATKLLQL